MRMTLFAKRNTKEILREPLNLFFGLAFPLVLLALMAIIDRSIPPEAGNTMFHIDSLAPGIATFAPAFLALFSGMLLSKDRTTSFLMRLFTSPMTALDFILGYTLPMLAMVVLQALVTFAAAALFGLVWTIHVLTAIAVTVVVGILYVGIGLLCGSVMSDKAVGGVCGALLTNVAGWLSGVWIPLDLIGGGFKATAEALPFYHAVQAAKAALAGNIGGVMPHLAVVLVYTVAFYSLAIFVFNRKMRGDNQ